MYRGSVRDIDALTKIDPIIWKLAALQNTDPQKIDLQGLSIDIYKASPAVLRLALITVGLNKDIENLFHPKHSNAAFVRHLGQHDDSVVQQYSVWSVIENRRLSFNDLGVPVDQIEGLPPNVQSKVYQLVAQRDPDLRRRLEITQAGSYRGSIEGREGLARGLKKEYYDGLEEVTIEWFRQELHRPVRELLAEHVGRFANECGPYEDLAFEIVEGEPILLERLLLGAEGKPIYGKIKGRSGRDLFDGQDRLIETIREGLAGKVPRKLTVLLLAASPLDAGRIRFDQECREIREHLNSLGSPEVSIEIDVQLAVRSTDISTHLLNSDAQILHFSGHASGSGLVFEDAQGNSVQVAAEALVSLISSLRMRFQCVVLNACLKWTPELGPGIGEVKV
jgi:hypothetical protein